MTDVQRVSGDLRWGYVVCVFVSCKTVVINVLHGSVLFGDFGVLEFEIFVHVSPLQFEGVVCQYDLIILLGEFDNAFVWCYCPMEIESVSFVVCVFDIVFHLGDYLFCNLIYWCCVAVFLCCDSVKRILYGFRCKVLSVHIGFLFLFLVEI